MGSFSWNETYSVNVKEIDEQHKRLFALISELHEAMMKGQGKQVLGKILGGLVSYASTHFAHEERLLKANNYPDFEAHHDVHVKMTQKVYDIQKQHQEGKLNITLDTMRFLENWIGQHIMGTDKKYSSYLNSRGVF